jgi:predicted aspartyl protease
MLTTRFPMIRPDPLLFRRPALLGPIRLAQAGFPAAGPANAVDQLMADGAIVQVTLTKPAAGGAGTPVTLNAMIDTGASISTVQDSVAQRAGLQQTGSTQLSGVGGVQTSPIYAASLAIPEFGVTVDAIEVASVQNPFPGVEMLLGRDLLRNLSLEYHGLQGQFALKSDTPLPGGVPPPRTLSPVPAPSAGISTGVWIAGGAALAALTVGGLFLFKVL